MKKIMCLSLCAALAFSLSACKIEIKTNDDAATNTLKKEQVELETQNKQLEKQNEQFKKEIDKLKEKVNEIEVSETNKSATETPEAELIEKEEELKKLEEQVSEEINNITLHYIKDGKYVKEETSYDKKDTLRVAKKVASKYGLSDISSVINYIHKDGEIPGLYTFDFKKTDIENEEYKDFLTSLAVTFLLEMDGEEIRYSIDETPISIANSDGQYLTKNILLENWIDIMPSE